MSAEKKLSKLHELLCDELLDRLKNGEEEVTKEGEVVKVGAKASTLNVIRQFLKDNGVEAVPAQGSALGDLVRELPDDFKVQLIR